MRKTGFTVIELLVVATIIIVLSTVGLVSYRQAGKNSRNAKRKADLETVRQALVLYYSDNNTYPSGDFDSALNTLSDQGYLTFENLRDPRESDGYGYSYGSQSGGAEFWLCADLETDPEETYCIYNP